MPWKTADPERIHAPRDEPVPGMRPVSSRLHQLVHSFAMPPLKNCVCGTTPAVPRGVPDRVSPPPAVDHSKRACLVIARRPGSPCQERPSSYVCKTRPNLHNCFCAVHGPAATTSEGARRGAPQAADKTIMGAHLVDANLNRLTFARQKVAPLAPGQLGKRTTPTTE